LIRTNLIKFLDLLFNQNYIKMEKKSILNPIDEIIFQVILYKNSHIAYSDLCQAIEEIFNHYNIKNNKN